MFKARLDGGLGAMVVLVVFSNMIDSVVLLISTAGSLRLTKPVNPVSVITQQLCKAEQH